MNRRYTVNSQQLAEALKKADASMRIIHTLLGWCAVHGSLQLALRHPEFPPSTRHLIEPFIEQLGKALVEAGFCTGDTLREALDTEQRFHAPRIEKN